MFVLNCLLFFHYLHSRIKFLKGLNLHNFKGNCSQKLGKPVSSGSFVAQILVMTSTFRKSDQMYATFEQKCLKVVQKPQSHHFFISLSE